MPLRGLVNKVAQIAQLSVGVFLQRDPIGFGGGQLNEYEFVGDNPVDRRDPSGLIQIPGFTPEENEIIERFLNGRDPKGIEKLAQAKREQAARWFEERVRTGKIKNINRAREFNLERARAIREGCNSPGSLKNFNDRFVQAQKAQALRIMGRGAGLLGLIGGMLYLGSGEPVPPTELGIPEDAEFVKSVPALAGDQQTWRLPDGKLVTVTVRQ